MKSGLVITLLLVFANLNTQAQSVGVSHSVVYKDAVIKWLSIEEAEAAQKKNPKKILVNVYTNWCRWCKVEDSVSYKNAEIAKYINQNFYPVKFNAEGKAAVTFKEVRYNFIDDENIYVHEFARYLLNGRMSYPGTVFIDEQGKIIAAKNGYMDAYYLEAVLNYYSTGAYKTMTYTDFESDFDGKIKDAD
jgi:thioredoxin-related protein